MSAPLLTHRPDFRLYHALYCSECWALAIRRERPVAGLAVGMEDRTTTLVQARIGHRVFDLSTGYFGGEPHP